MSDPKQGIALTALAKISQMTVDELKELLTIEVAGQSGVTLGELSLDGPDVRGLYPYSDALAIEIARQLSDFFGLPLPEALRMVAYTGAAEHFAALSEVPHHPETEFWVAVTGARNTWPGGERGSIAVTGFGADEYWSTAHYHGTFDQVTREIADRISTDDTDYPGSDVARVFMTNVSAADRRLRRRV